MKLLTIFTITLGFTLSYGQFSFGQNIRQQLNQKFGSQQFSLQPPGAPQIDVKPPGLDPKFPGLPQGNDFMDWISKNKAASWKIGRNFLDNTPLAFLQKMGGSVIRKPHDSLRGFTVLTDTKPETFKLPEDFDARTNWPHCSSINEISNQRTCGSCWAVSTADVMTDRTCILSEGKKTFRYSTQDLLTCCSDCGDGCDGGDPYVAYDYWINNGIVSGGYNDSYQGCLQYNIPQCNQVVVNSSQPACDSENVITPECKKDCLSTYKISYENDLKRGEKAYNISTMEDAMYELVTKGPINAIMQVYTDFFSYKSGIYQVTPGTATIGGHAIRIIGYGQENGVPFWLCANSWNENWGANGFFKILRGKNEAGIEDYLLAGLPKLKKDG